MQRCTSKRPAGRCGGGHVNVAYVVNPAAGLGRGKSVWQRLVSHHPDLEKDAFVTQKPGDGESLAEKAFRRGYDAVIAVGGDGTLHEVLNGALQVVETPLIGLIPAGTGNDFARGVYLPRDPVSALQTSRNGRVCEIDIGLVNGRAFINVAGFGFDAAVAQEVASRTGKGASGAIPYLLAVFNQLRRYRPTEVSIQVDDERMEAPVFLGAVGNGSTYGGGMRICPRARVDDGQLDLCVATDLGRLETIMNLVKVFRGSHLTHPKCVYRRARRITVDGDRSVLVHADGQLLGSLPVTFEIEAKSIRFIMGDAFSPSTTANVAAAL